MATSDFFNKTKKVKCVKCGREVEERVSPFDEVQGIDTLHNYICDTCYCNEQMAKVNFIRSKGFDIKSPKQIVAESDEAFIVKLDGKRVAVFK